MAWITSDGKWHACLFDLMSAEEYANYVKNIIKSYPHFDTDKLFAQCDEIIRSGHYDGEKLNNIIDFENEYTQSLLANIQQEVN